MIRSNYSVLPWYTKLSQQNHRNFYAYGRAYALYTGINQVPPFQLVRAKTGAQIDYFKIVNFKTGVETDVTSAIIVSGLTVYEGTDYDIIIYPATVGIGSSTLFEEGGYYAKMSDGSNIWYSDVFAMSSRVDQMIKVQFCHAQDMSYTGGLIRYEDGFKNYVYVNSTIGKPNFEYEEEVTTRNGYTFPLQQTSWKSHQFDFAAPEYLADLFRLIKLHDYVTIYNQDITFECDEFTPTTEWQEQGDLAIINCEFKTDTVVSVSGRSVTSETCPINEGLCLTVQYNVVATIVLNSDEYNGFYYENNGVNTSFVAGDYVLVIEGGVTRLYQFTRISTYQLVSALGNEVAYDQRTGIYYARPLLSNEFLPAAITSLNLASGDTWNLNWRGIPGSVCEFYVQSADGNERLVAIKESGVIDLAIQFERKENDISALMKVTSAKCGVFYTTDYFPFEGVGAWIVETDFDVQ